MQMVLDACQRFSRWSESTHKRAFTSCGERARTGPSTYP